MKALRSRFFVYRFTLSGLNLERFVNTLQRAGVPLPALRRVDLKTLSCVCYAADLKAIRALAEEKGWRMGEASPLYLAALCRRLKRRPGLAIGALAALGLMIASLQFIWQVNIVGAGAYRADIAAYLQGEGVAPGRLRAAVNAKALESALSRRYPKVAWFYVYAYNTTLVVECVQGSPPPEKPAMAAGDLLAKRDGVIHSLRVFAGTAAVQPGDIVKEGQPLIYGWERGRDDQRVAVRARGEVIARCWRSATARVSLKEADSWETGREAAARQLCTPWFALPAQLQAPAYLTANVYQSRQPVGGAFFPCWLQTTQWREVAMEYAFRSLTEALDEARRAAESKLKNALKGYEIIDKWVDYCMIEDGIVAATVTGEWRADIGGGES